MNLYISGKGGPYKSILINNKDYIYINENDLSGYEKIFIEKYLENHHWKNKVIYSLQDIHDKEIHLSFYALDQNSLKVVKTLAAQNNKLFYNNKTIFEAQIECYVRFSTLMRDKVWFYNKVAALDPSLTIMESLKLKNYDDLINALPNIKSADFPVVIKCSAGKGGKGNIVCYNFEDLEKSIKIIESRTFSSKSEYSEDAKKSSFIVEQFYEDITSYNVTFNCITSDNQPDLNISEQIIEEVFYRGNKSITNLTEVEISKIKNFALKFRESIITNFEGWIGIDLIKTPFGIKAIEVNPRINSVSDVFKLSKNHFILRLVEFKPYDFSSPDIFQSLGNQLFDPSTGLGFLPYQINEGSRLMLLYFSQAPLNDKEYEFMLDSIGLKKVTQLKEESTRSLSLSYYLLHSESKFASETTVTNYIVISTEDDKYLVKGGIGTYLGNLIRGIQRVYPSIQILWITQSPNTENFVEKRSNTEIRYISTYQGELKLSAAAYSNLLENEVKNAVKKIKFQNKKYKILIESPEWEGLLSSYFQVENDRNILKITRIHTPLAVTLKLSGLQTNSDNELQLKKEYNQLKYSEVLSAPTQYIFNLTNNVVLKNNFSSINKCIIPNPIDVDNFVIVENRQQSIKFFREITKCPIDEKNFNIFIVGSVEKRKGVEIVFKMIPKILLRIPNAHFYFIGHCVKDKCDNLTANIKLSAQEIFNSFASQTIPHIHVVGYIEHSMLPKIMGAGDIFPICYLGDNFPGVVTEIGLAKRPLIVLLKGGIPEMIKNSEDEYLCITVKEGTYEEISEEFSDNILKFFNGEANKSDLPEALKRHLIENFSSKKIVQDLLTFYQHEIEKKQENVRFK